MSLNGKSRYVAFLASRSIQKSNACVYRVHDSVWFNQVQISDVPEPVHLWLDRTITKFSVITGEN